MLSSLFHLLIFIHLISFIWTYTIPEVIDDNTLEYEEVRDGTKPQQVHLSLGNDSSQMIVTWSTLKPVDTLVRYGIGNLVSSHLGTMTNFSNDGHHIQYIHSAIMDQLIPSSTYIYQVGSGNADEMSPVYNFTTLPLGENWSPRFCVYGDLGLVNAKSFPRILADVKKGMYDVILHVGDFAYDLNSNFGDIGNKFLQMIEPVAVRVPYMTTPGNHERHFNFSNYKFRFRMPNNGNQNMFYSYTVGPARIISFSTEYYIYIHYGTAQLLNQYRWLIHELKEADQPENRAHHPWIIVLGHRPLYCTNSHSKSCTIIADWLRYGVPHINFLGIEQLLYKYHVDLAIWAHEHTYERMWPVYQEKVVNSSTPSRPYHNPKATVHIVSGSAGCQENHSKFPTFRKDYSAFRSTDYGYSRMTVHNKTHLHFEQVSDDQDGKIIDSIWLTKT